MAKAGGVIKGGVIKKSDLPPITEIYEPEVLEEIKKKDLEKYGSKTTLHLSSMESFFVWEALRVGYYAQDQKDLYLQFDNNNVKLVNIHVTGRPTEARMKQIGLDLDKMFLLPAEIGSDIFSTISKNRSETYGTEIYLYIKNPGVIDSVKMKQVRAFEF